MNTRRIRTLRRLTYLAYLLGALSLVVALALSPLGVFPAAGGTLSWTNPDDPSQTVSFTTPDTYSACPTGVTTDTLTTSGIPDDWTLIGQIVNQYVLDGGARVTIETIPVNQTGNLNATVTYPPAADWPAQSNGTREIHVDISIEVYDETGARVEWVGNFPGVLGPGNQWDVFCLELPAATDTPVVPTDTPVPLPTDTPVGPTATPGGPTSTPTPLPTSTPDDPQVIITDPKQGALSIDNDGDGALTPGDTIGYSVVISNVGTLAATSVIFADTPDPNTTLIAGSVTTTQGTIVTGNTPGDTTVVIDIGTLAIGASVEVTYQATVNSPLAPGVSQIVNQGVTSGDNFADQPTDDPSTAPADDPTVLLIGSGGGGGDGDESGGGTGGTGAAQLVPVTGVDLTTVRQFTYRQWLDLGFVFLGVGLALNGLTRRLSRRQTGE